MHARARHQGGETRDKVQRLEQAALGILPLDAFIDEPWRDYFCLPDAAGAKVAA